jgi:hypothetical protein
LIVAPLAAAFVVAVVAATVARAEPRLGLPIVCDIGRDCFVQQYVDLDPGPEARDYMCGLAAYDGHKGIDIRLVDTADVARSVPVVAAAAGTVRGRRDGVADRLVKSKADKAAVRGRECGNGVVLDHGDGWETQYCHLLKGSVTVGSGARVERGQKLGEVGYSGDAGFAHVHLSVRHDGKVVDPFRGLQDGTDCGPGAGALWDEAARAALGYAPTRLLAIGLADRGVKLGELETGAVSDIAPNSNTSALVVWGWAINLEKDDVLELRLDGPAGKIAASETPFDRRKAQYMAFSGGKRPSGGWRPGRYTATVAIRRGAAMVGKSQSTFEIE